MFKKTKWKIALTVALSLFALMAVTLTTIYISNILSVQKKNEDMLKTYVERYGREDLGGEPFDEGFRPEGDILPPEAKDFERNGKDEPAFRLSTFYSVAYSASGEVLSVQSGNSVIKSEEELIEIASSVIEKGEKSGTVGSMTYLVDRRADITLVAMIDSTISDNNQKMLFEQMILIGSIATVALFIISIFIASRIVRPLEENDKKQKRFVSDAGHELKTPIAVINANLELLKRSIGENEWLDNIEYENARMSALIKQLLSLSRAENAAFVKEQVDLSALVGGETLPFESLAYEKGAKIVTEIESGIDAFGNANQLRQLVSILIDNAISHGTGKEICVTLKSERHCVRLAVSNESEKIDENTLNRLFDRFYRADDSRTDSGAHYGLGLAIAKAIAEAHGGKIQAEYKEGKAIFTVTLPIKKV